MIIDWCIEMSLSSACTESDHVHTHYGMEKPYLISVQVWVFGMT